MWIVYQYKTLFYTKLWKLAKCFSKLCERNNDEDQDNVLHEKSKWSLVLPQFKTYKTSVRKIIIFEKLWNRSTIPKRAKDKEVQLSSLFAWKKTKKERNEENGSFKRNELGRVSNWMGKYTIRFIIHMQIKFLIIYISNAKNKY